MKKAKKNVHNFGVEVGPGETASEVISRTILSPVTQAAITIAHFVAIDGTLQADFEFKDFMHNLERQISGTLKSEKLEESQRMLIAQAHTLDGLFNAMVKTAANNLNKNLGAAERLLKIGLKAQTQCRVTLEAINNIKNPRLANIVNQANIAAGHQQVNNFTETEIQPNELLKESHERVDVGATKAAGREHSAVETMGAVNRPNKRGRKKQSVE